MPFVLVNMAMSADGKIATANRAVDSFGSARDRAHLFELRATADAVMCGARTVAAGVDLGPGGLKYRRLRQQRGLSEHPLRVIVSGSGSVDPGARVFANRTSPVIVLVSGRATPARLRRLRRVADEVMVCGQTTIDFARVFADLRRRRGVKRLLCEGGGELNDALFRAGLVNELHLTLCPLILGGRAAPTIADGAGVPRLADATQLRLRSSRRIGDELFCVFDVLRRTGRPG